MSSIHSRILVPMVLALLVAAPMRSQSFSPHGLSEIERTFVYYLRQLPAQPGQFQTNHAGRLMRATTEELTRCEPLILQGLRHPVEEIRGKTLLAVQNMLHNMRPTGFSDRLRDRLVEMLHSPEQGRVHDWQVLDLLGDFDERAAPALPKLLVCLEEHPKHVHPVLLILRYGFGPAGVPALRKVIPLQNSPDESVAKLARETVRTLTELRSQRPSMKSRLEKLRTRHRSR